MPGGQKTWSRRQCIAALQKDAKRRGRSPSMAEWAHARASRPCAATIVCRFGSWRKAMAAARLKPRGTGRRTRWTRQEVLDAMRAWQREHGAWPNTLTWGRTGGTDHPSAKTVLDLLGVRGWSQAVAVAAA